MNRREFLRTTGYAAAAMLQPGSTPASVDAEITITPRPNAPIISPHLYGQFLEHLGGVIYDGVWVGERSKIPNIGGIRKQFIDDMKAIGVPNFRWPGGCFADGYHWHDGVGPAAARPRTYNYWQATTPTGVDATETNRFGLHEFMRLCRLTGATPYLAANMASGSPREFHDWVTYCNAARGTATLAEERAANGDPAPFNVRWWGVGNESWGCGGDMTPQEYATLYRRFVTQFPSYAPKPMLVAVGPRGHSKDLDLSWTEGFFQSMQGHKTPVDGLSMHYYSDFRKSRERVVRFDARGWYDVLHEGLRTDQVIEAHWAIAQKYSPATRLVLDEWGVWYPPGEEIGPAYLLSQPLTLRDALHTALTFDVFNRHADKLAMANVAQTINCLHSLFLAQGDKFARTPVYFVFQMYRTHMGSQPMQLQIRGEDIQVPTREGGVSGASVTEAATYRMPGLSCSASLRTDVAKSLTVTLTNPSLEHAIRARIRLSGGSILEGRGSVLTHPEMNATNTLDHPEEVKLAPIAVSVRDTGAELTLQARSVASLELRFA